jgi:hypothetical protein
LPLLIIKALLPTGGELEIYNNKRSLSLQAADIASLLKIVSATAQGSRAEPDLATLVSTAWISLQFLIDSLNFTKK